MSAVFAPPAAEAPAADLDTFACPPHLTGAAREFWEWIVPLLLKEGWLTKFDVHALEMMCQTWQDWHEFRAEARKKRYYKAPGGWWAAHPSFKLADECHKQLIAHFKQFGMFPLERARLRMSKPPKQEDDDDDYKRFRKGVVNP